MQSLSKTLYVLCLVLCALYLATDQLIYLIVDALLLILAAIVDRMTRPLQVGKTYRVSRATPLLPQPIDRDLPSPMERALTLNRGQSFRVIGTRQTEAGRREWYEVQVGGLSGSYWIPAKSLSREQVTQRQKQSSVVTPPNDCQNHQAECHGQRQRDEKTQS